MKANKLQNTYALFGLLGLFSFLSFSVFSQVPSIHGNIFFEDNSDPIYWTTVNIKGECTDYSDNSSSAIYSYPYTTGDNYTVRVDKFGQYHECLNVSDYLAVQKLIEDCGSFSGYDKLAADVNRDGIINYEDAGALLELIKNNGQTIPYGFRNWIFLPDDYVLPSTPYNGPPPIVEEVVIPSISADTVVNFTGVKSGEMYDCVDISYYVGDDIVISDAVVNYGDYFTVSVSAATQFYEISGLEFELFLPYNVTFESVSGFNIDGLSLANFGLEDVYGGYLKFVWTAPIDCDLNASTITAGQKLFDINFTATDYGNSFFDMGVSRLIYDEDIVHQTLFYTGGNIQVNGCDLYCFDIEYEVNASFTQIVYYWELIAYPFCPPPYSMSLYDIWGNLITSGTDMLVFFNNCNDSGVIYTYVITHDETGATCGGTIVMVNDKPFISYLPNIDTTNWSGNCEMQMWWPGPTISDGCHSMNLSTWSEPAILSYLPNGLNQVTYYATDNIDTTSRSFYINIKAPAVPEIEWTNVETMEVNFPPGAVPDGCASGNYNGVVNVGGIPYGSKITDVNMDLIISTTWAGDLSAELFSPDGTRVVLFNRPGSIGDFCSGGGFGCNSDNMFITLDDDAENDYCAFEGSCPSPIVGTFPPKEAFTVFDNLSPIGNWTMNMYDAVAVDPATVDTATLKIEYSSPKSTTPGLCELLIFDNYYDLFLGDTGCPDETLTHNWPIAPSNTSLNGASFPLGESTVTWTATNSKGSTTYSQLIIVEDQEPPYLNYLPDLEVNVPFGSNGTTLNGIYVDPYDNCSFSPYVEYYITDPSGFQTMGFGDPSNLEFFELGTSQLEYFVYDDYGNISYWSFFITVVEMDCVVECLPLTVITNNIILVEDFLAPGNTCLTGLSMHIIETDATGSGVLIGCNEYSPFTTYTVDVTHGPSNNTCQTQLTVVDQPPVAQCLSSITLLLDGSGFAFINAEMVDAGSFDDCVIATKELDHNGNFNCTDIGANIINLIVTDNWGNTSDCPVVVNVADQEAPIYNAPLADVTVECDEVLPPADPVPSDNCQFSLDFTETSTQGGNPQFANYYNYTITRNWVAVDESSNSAVETQTIDVEDTQAPTSPTYTFSANFINPNTIGTNNNDCFATIGLNLNSVTDNCAALAYITISNNSTFGNGLSDASGNYPPGNYDITFTATDPSGNTSEFTQSFSVVDNVPPVANNCPNDISVNIPWGQGGTNVTWGGPDLFDNCGLVVNSSHNPGDYFNTGTTTVVYTINDTAGNQIGDCSFSVTVIEVLDCVVNLPNDTTICPGYTVNISAGEGYAAYLWNTGATTSSISVNDVGTQNYSVMVTCDDMTTATDDINVTWADTEAPTVNCFDITVNLNSNCEADFSIIDIAGNAIDNCTSLGLDLDWFPQGPFTEPGVNIVEVTVTDNEGNMSTCNATVTVVDPTPIFINCMVGYTLELEATGNGTLLPENILQSISANCDYTLELNQDAFSCADIGAQIVMLTATESSGSTATCTSIISIVDNIPPVVTYCPPDTTIVVNASDLPVVVEGITPMFTDNCGSVTFSDPSGVGYSLGSTTLQIVATDANGNPSEPCTFTVTVDTTEVDNDHPNGSISIDPNTTCISFDGDVALATPSFPQPPECAAGPGTRDDLWYTFVAPSEPVTVKVAASPDFQAGIDVYASDQTFIDCEAADAPGSPDSLVLTGLTPGQNYFVRVYDINGDPPTTWFTVYIYVESCPLPQVIPHEGFHIAESQFTDEEGWTHYIKQDTLLLFSIMREGRDIGNVGDGTFEVAIQRDSNVYDVTGAPYALEPNTQYLMSGYYWNVVPNYAPGVDLTNPFTVRSYYVDEEYEALRNVCPEIEDHTDLTHYKVDGVHDGAAENTSQDLFGEAADADMHFFINGGMPSTTTYSFETFGVLGTEYLGGVCVIFFSGGGIMYKKVTVGVDEKELIWFDFNLMPVPAEDYIHLMFASPSFGEGQIEIFDSAGKLMMKSGVNYVQGDNEYKFDIQSFAAGVYHLRMVDKESLSKTLRFVKID